MWPQNILGRLSIDSDWYLPELKESTYIMRGNLLLLWNILKMIFLFYSIKVIYDFVVKKYSISLVVRYGNKVYVNYNHGYHNFHILLNLLLILSLGWVYMVKCQRSVICLTILFQKSWISYLWIVAAAASLGFSWWTIPTLMNLQMHWTMTQWQQLLHFQYWLE